MRNLVFPTMYVWHIPFDDGVAMSPKGVEPAVLSSEGAIQIARERFEKTISKAKSQDTWKPLEHRKSCQGIYITRLLIPIVILKPPQWPAFLPTQKAVLLKG